MGNLAMRSRFVKLTRIQKFSGSSKVVNHLKSDPLSGHSVATQEASSSSKSVVGLSPIMFLDCPEEEEDNSISAVAEGSSEAVGAGCELQADGEQTASMASLTLARRTASEPTDPRHRKVEERRESNSIGPRLSHSLTRSFKHDTSIVSTGAIGKPFPKRPIACKLSGNAWKKLEQLFRLMDTDGSNAVTREEAQQFFKGAFSNLSAQAMFNEVDVDASGAITAEEFVTFWLQVRAAGYKEQDIIDEAQELIEGGTWVDWQDTRDTDLVKGPKFPRRPIFCRLSGSTWMKCEELFRRIAGEHTLVITKDAAGNFFKGAFCNISAEAMFNEIDMNHHGVITPKEFMAFWLQVRGSGYKDADVHEEIERLLEGSPWVDWKDGRHT